MHTPDGSSNAQPVERIVPAHSFPGDDVGHLAYTLSVRTPLNDQAAVFHAGARACGLTLAAPEVERGCRVLAATYWLDDHMGRPGEGRDDRIQAVVSMAKAAGSIQSVMGLQLPRRQHPDAIPRPELANALRLLDTATNVGRGFDIGERRRMLQRIRTLGQCAMERPGAETVSVYVDLLRSHADAVADSISNAYLQEHDPQASRAPWRASVRTLMRGRVLRNAARDLEVEYDEGRTGLRPGWVHRAFLIGAGVCDLSQLANRASAGSRPETAHRQIHMAERSLAVMAWTDMRQKWTRRRAAALQAASSVA